VIPAFCAAYLDKCSRPVKYFGRKPLYLKVCSIFCLSKFASQSFV
jgi:hypothetical protein